MLYQNPEHSIYPNVVFRVFNVSQDYVLCKHHLWQKSRCNTMPNRKELQQISKTRLKEVKALYRNRLYDGAAYLSGYVIETALKARICRILKSDYLESGEIARSFLTHRLDNLVTLGGLRKEFDLEANSNINFKANWSLLAEGWNEALRYKPIGTSSQANVQLIINALEDTNDGVLTWIRRRW